MARKKKQPLDLAFLGVGPGGSPRPQSALSGFFAAGVAAESEMTQAQLVDINRLAPNPFQPRLERPDDTLDDLAGVIKAQGFQGVLVARPDRAHRGRYQLTAGHRRRDAALRAGLRQLPVVVHELTDEEMAVLAITENIQREDLTPVEEGRIFLLMSEEMGFTHEQIAREVGRKRGYVENRIRAARAPEDVQTLLAQKPDSIRAVATLVKVQDEALRGRIISSMLAGDLTVDDLPAYVESHARVPSATRHDERIAPERREPDHLAPAELDEARLGAARLASALRKVVAYTRASSARDDISEEEAAALTALKVAVGDLCKRYGIK